MAYIGRNFRNRGKYQKSGSERLFAILRQVTGENLVFLALTAEAVKTFEVKKNAI